MALSRPNRLLTWMLGAALVAATLWVYLPALTTNGWVYEDTLAMRGTTGSLYRPLTWLSYHVDMQLGGTPTIAHAQSLLWHLVNGLLVWLLLVKLLGPGRLGTAAATALFLVGPLSTQAVAYAAARADLLATAGVLLACVAAVYQPRSAPGLIVVGLAWALASKESAIIGPLLVLLCLSATGRIISASTGVLFYPVVAGLVFAIWGIGARLGGEGYAAYGWPEYLARQSHAVFNLTVQTAIPANLSVDVDYDAIPAVVAWLSAVIVWGMGGLALSTFLADPTAPAARVALGALWLLAAVLPRFCFRLPEWLNAHQFYLPAVGAYLVLGVFVNDVWQRATGPTVAVEGA